MVHTQEEKSALSETNRERIMQLAKSGNEPERLKAISPIFMVLDLTWKCNSNCRGCIDGPAVMRGKKPTLPYEAVADIVDYAAAMGVRGFMVMGGELFLYEDNSATIDDFLNLCADKRIPIYAVSNGVLLGKHLDSSKRIFKTDGSRLRVSINADRDNYQYHTRTNYELDDILQSIRVLTSEGIEVNVTTVFYPQSASCIEGIKPNITQLENISKSIADAGVSKQAFIPARHPATKEMVQFTSQELKMLEEISAKIYNRILKPKLAPLFYTQMDMPAEAQNKDYCPCPSSLLKAIVGSDGKLYVCTDHRGEASQDVVIGELTKPGDFEGVWHSLERVQRQRAFIPKEKCCKITCMRYELNIALATMMGAYEKYRTENIIEHFLLPQTNTFSF